MKKALIPDVLSEEILRKSFLTRGWSVLSQQRDGEVPAGQQQRKIVTTPRAQGTRERTYIIGVQWNSEPYSQGHSVDQQPKRDRAVAKVRAETGKSRKGILRLLSLLLWSLPNGWSPSEAACWGTEQAREKGQKWSVGIGNHDVYVTIVRG